MKKWSPIIIPLTGGVDQMSPAIDGDPATLNSNTNVDLGDKGAIKARPGFVRQDGFTERTLAAGFTPNTAAYAAPTNWANLPARYKTGATIYKHRDSAGERPGIMTQGHLWTREADGWADRLYGGSASVTRSANFAQLIDGTPASQLAAAPSLGPVTTYGTSGIEWQILGTNGAAEYRAQGAQAGPGNAARIGTTEMVVTVDNGSALRWTVGATGNPILIAGTLAFDAQVPSGTGDIPCICADLNTGVFFVAYATTTAHQVKVLRVTTGGAITHTHSFTIGTGTITGVWVCNTNTADNKVCVCVTDSVAATGMFSRLLSQTTLTNLALDVTIHATVPMQGQVVCGAANANGTTNIWLAFVEASGLLNIWWRSSTAATSTFVTDYTGWGYGVAHTAQQGRAFYLTHQPITVGNRVVLGVGVLYGWGANTNNMCTTWYEWDITDLHVDNSTIGTRWAPVLLAQGPFEGTSPAWNPAAAVVGTDNASWAFPSTNWRDFIAGYPNVSNVLGLYPVLGVNTVAFLRPAVDFGGVDTYIAGSVPHQVGSGWAHEAGWPVLGRPPVQASGAAGTHSYTCAALWRWTDEAGRVHRSAPSVKRTISGVTTPLSVSSEGPLTEREYDSVYIDYYVSTVDPVAAAPLYLQTSVKCTRRGGGPFGAATTVAIGSIDTTQDVLYTSGGIAPAFPPRADGGLATVDRRMWTSDGSALYASKLPETGANFATEWSNQDQFVVQMPATSGRVVALAPLDDKLLVLCTRGVYIVTGQGPDNTGVGPNFSVPFKLSDLGVAGPRAYAATLPHGVFFVSAPAGGPTDDYGNIWVMDRALSVRSIGSKVKGWLAASGTPTPVSDLVWSPDREILVATHVAGIEDIVWDARTNRWCSWSFPDGTTSGVLTAAIINGALWNLGDNPGGFTDQSAPGHDFVPGSTNFYMAILTNHLAADGHDVFGWSRVRSVRPVGQMAGIGHTLDISVTLDITGLTSGASFFTPYTPPGGTTWPSSRYCPEYRLLQQKCSQIQVSLVATPATALWSAIELQVEPLGRAPAGQRG